LIKIAIIGAGGHTRTSINLLLNCFNNKEIVIYDDSFAKDKKQEIVNGIPLIGNIDDIKSNQSIFLSICDNVIIGAGSVVIRDIEDAGTYVGNPAKRIK